MKRLFGCIFEHTVSGGFSWLNEHIKLGHRVWDMDGMASEDIHYPSCPWGGLAVCIYVYIESYVWLFSREHTVGYWALLPQNYIFVRFNIFLVNFLDAVSWTEVFKSISATGVRWHRVQNIFNESIGTGCLKPNVPVQSQKRSLTTLSCHRVKAAFTDWKDYFS